MVVAHGRSLGVDLIGCPGPLGDPYAWERYLMFRRAGLPIVPIGYAEWQTDPDRCVQAVRQSTEGVALGAPPVIRPQPAIDGDSL